MYSAGLKRREADAQVLFAGIASIASKADLIGPRDLVLIDEAHLIGPNASSMYQKLIAGLSGTNLKLRVVGFTATPYRTGQGVLTDSGLFTNVAYDLTSMAKFNKLIVDGYLAPLVSKRTEHQLDVTDVPIVNGDYNQTQLEATVDTNDQNYQICKEMTHYGATRKKWLVFASGIAHSEHLAEMLRNFGISTVAVHSKTGEENRDKAILDFKNGTVRCLVNNNVLTTGFDFPGIDFIGMVRPTTSTGLWVQMLGRGTRVSDATGKRNCLVLDFAKNTERLGPINDPRIPNRKGESAAGPPPVRICPSCGVYNHASARKCSECGCEFPVQTKLEREADTLDLIRDDTPTLEWFGVHRTFYGPIRNPQRPPMLKVTYVSGGQSFSELVSPGHPKFQAWWEKRSPAPVPQTVEQVLKHTQVLRVPERIHVWTNAKPYPRVMSVAF